MMDVTVTATQTASPASATLLSPIPVNQTVQTKVTATTSTVVSAHRTRSASRITAWTMRVPRSARIYSQANT